jgi:hypothetical protein
MKILLSGRIRMGQVEYRVILSSDRVGYRVILSFRSYQVGTSIRSSSIESFQVSDRMRSSRIVSGRVSNYLMLGHFGFQIISGRVRSNIRSFNVRLF